jgi:hypothetical protein
MRKFHIALFAVSLSIYSFKFNLSADTPQIRISVDILDENGNDVRMLSALSHEFRKLDGVVVTDTHPMLKVSCSMIELTSGHGKVTTGYGCSFAVTDAEDHLITHNIGVHTSINKLAHEVATLLDGTVIERMRRTGQPLKSP